MNMTSLKKLASIDSSGLVSSFSGLVYSYKQIGETLLYSTNRINISMTMIIGNDKPMTFEISSVKIITGDKEIIISHTKVTLNGIVIDQNEILRIQNVILEKKDFSTYKLLINDTEIEIFRVGKSIDLTLKTKDCKYSLGILGNCESAGLNYNNGTKIDIESLTNLELNEELNLEYGSKVLRNYNFIGKSVYLKNSSFITDTPICTFTLDISIGIKFKIQEIRNDATLISYDKDGHGFSLFINSKTHILTIETSRKLLQSSLSIIPRVWYSMLLYWEADTKTFHISLLQYGSIHSLSDVINVGFETVHPCGFLTIGQRSDLQLFADFNGYIDDLILWPTSKRINDWKIDITMASNYWSFDIENSKGGYDDEFTMINLVSSWKRTIQSIPDYIISTDPKYISLVIHSSKVDEQTKILCNTIYEESGCKSLIGMKSFFIHHCSISLYNISLYNIYSQLKTISQNCNSTLTTYSILFDKACILSGKNNCSIHCVFGKLVDSKCYCLDGYWGEECQLKCKSSYCDRLNGNNICDKAHREDNCVSCSVDWYGEHCSIYYNHDDGDSCRTLSSNGYSTFNGLYFSIQRAINLLLYESIFFKIYVKQNICFTDKYCIHQLLVKYPKETLLIALDSKNHLKVFINGNSTALKRLSNILYNLTIYKDDLFKLDFTSGESVTIIGYKYFIGITIKKKLPYLLTNAICFRPENPSYFDSNITFKTLNETYLNKRFADSISVNNNDFINLNYNGNHDRCLSIEGGYLITKLMKNMPVKYLTYQLTIKLESSHDTDIISIIGIDKLTIFLNNISKICIRINNYIIITDLEILENRWYSLSVVINSNNNEFIIYSINENSMQSKSFKYKYNISLNTTIMISSEYQNNNFKKEINDFRIWNRVLTENEVLRSYFDHDIIHSYSNVIAIFTFDEIDANGIYKDIINDLAMQYVGNSAQSCYVNGQLPLNKQIIKYDNLIHLHNLCKKYISKIYKICYMMPEYQMDLYLLACQHNIKMLPLKSTLEKSSNDMALVCISDYNITSKAICRQVSITLNTCKLVTRLDLECQFGEVTDGKCTCDRGFWDSKCSQRCRTKNGNFCMGICNENNGACLCENDNCYVNLTYPIHPINTTLLAAFGYGSILRNDSIIQKIHTPGSYKLLSIGNIHVKGLYVFCEHGQVVCMYSITIETDIKSRVRITIDAGDTFYSAIRYSSNTIADIQVNVISTLICEIRFIAYQNVVISIYKTDNYLNLLFRTFSPDLIIHPIFDSSVDLRNITIINEKNKYPLDNIQLFQCHFISSYLIRNVFGITPAIIQFEMFLKTISDQGILFSYSNENGDLFCVRVFKGKLAISINENISYSSLVLNKNEWKHVTLRIYHSKSFVNLVCGNESVILQIFDVASKYFYVDGYLRIGGIHCKTITAQFALFKIKENNLITAEWIFTRQNEKDIITPNIGKYNLFIDSSYDRLHEIQYSREVVPFNIPSSNIKDYTKIRTAILLCIESLSLFNNSHLIKIHDSIDICKYEVFNSNGKEGSILSIVLVLNSLKHVNGLCKLFDNYPLLYGDDCSRHCYFKDISSSDNICKCMVNYIGSECNIEMNPCSGNKCICPLNRIYSDHCEICAPGFKGKDCAVLLTGLTGRASFINGGNVFTLEGMSFFYRSQNIITMYSDDNMIIYALQVELSIINIKIIYAVNKTLNFLISSSDTSIYVDNSKITILDLKEFIITSQFSMYRIDTSIYRISSSYISIEIHVQEHYMNLLIETSICNSLGLLGCNNSHVDYILNNNFELKHFFERIHTDSMIPDIVGSSLYFNHSTSVSDNMKFISNKEHFTIITNCLLKQSIPIHTLFTYVFKDNTFISIQLSKSNITFIQKNNIVVFYIKIEYNQIFSLSFSYNNLIKKLLMIYKTSTIIEIREQYMEITDLDSKGNLYLGGSNDDISSYEGIIESFSIFNNYYTISGLIQKLSKLIVLKDDNLLFHWKFNLEGNSVKDSKRGTHLYLHPDTTWIYHLFTKRDLPLSSYQPYRSVNINANRCKRVLNRLFSATCNTFLSAWAKLVCEETLGRVISTNEMYLDSLIYDSAMFYKWHCPAADSAFNKLCNKFPIIEFPMVGGYRCDISCIFGVIRNDICICSRGYYGDECQLLCSGGADRMCSGHGICSGSFGECKCAFNWNGQLILNLFCFTLLLI